MVICLCCTCSYNIIINLKTRNKYRVYFKKIHSTLTCDVSFLGRDFEYILIWFCAVSFQNQSCKKHRTTERRHDEFIAYYYQFKT